MSDTPTHVTITPTLHAAKAVAPSISSWAVPTERDDEIWAAMTREQQLTALQDHFASDDCTTPSTRTVAEIVARARADRSPQSSK